MNRSFSSHTPSCTHPTTTVAPPSVCRPLCASPAIRSDSRSGWHGFCQEHTPPPKFSSRFDLGVGLLDGGHLCLRCARLYRRPTPSGHSSRTIKDDCPRSTPSCSGGERPCSPRCSRARCIPSGLMCHYTLHVWCWRIGFLRRTRLLKVISKSLMQKVLLIVALASQARSSQTEMVNMAHLSHCLSRKCTRWIEQLQVQWPRTFGGAHAWGCSDEQVANGPNCTPKHQSRRPDRQSHVKIAPNNHNACWLHRREYPRLGLDD